MARYRMIWSFYVFRSLSLGCFFSPLLCAVGPLVFSKKEQVSILVTELNVSMLLPKNMFLKCFITIYLSLTKKHYDQDDWK